MAYDVCGYAALFDRPFHPADGSGAVPAGARMVLDKGAVNVTKAAPFVAFMHNEGQRYASAFDGGLAIWSDHVGVAFAFNVSNSSADFSLMQGISDGRYDRVSANWLLNQTREDGDLLHVSMFEITEISICPEGLCPDACAWLSATDPDDLPDHSRALARHWRTGFQARALAKVKRNASAAKAHTGHKAVAPARLVALMQSPSWRAGAAMNATAAQMMRPGGGGVAISGANELGNRGPLNFTHPRFRT